MEKTESLDIFCSLHFPYEIKRIADRERGIIGYLMCDHDVAEIFLKAPISLDFPAHGRGRGPCAKGRPAASLYARVHVGFIVKTDIEDIVVPLRSTRHALKTYVISPAIPCEPYHSDLFSLFLKSCLHACQACSGVLKSRVEKRHFPCTVRECGTENDSAACRDIHRSIFSKYPYRVADRHRNTASRTCSMPCCEQVLIGQVLDRDHMVSPLVLCQFISFIFSPFAAFSVISNIFLICSSVTSLPPRPAR